MFGDISEAANQITTAFAQLNANLAKQIEQQQQQNQLLQSIDQRLADIQSIQLRKSK